MVDLVEQSRTLIRILQTIGLWSAPSDEGKWYLSYFPRSFTWILHGPLTFFYITLMWLKAVFEPEIDKTLDILYLVLTETALIIKIFNMVYHSRRAKDLIGEWSTEREYELKTVEEKVYWKKTQKFFGLVSFIYIVCSVSVIIFSYIYHLICGNRVLVFDFWVPFDLSIPENYWPIWTYGFISVLLTCITNITLDMINCYFVLHLAMCFRVIGMRFEHLKNENDSVKVFHNIKKIIKLHQKVVRSSKTCEAIISYPSLAQILLSAFVLCFSIYRLKGINIREDFGTFVAMVQFGLVMTLQIFLPCYYANEVTINSAELLNKSYNSDWPNMSISNRRLILIYMEYVKKPVELKAGPFFEMGLPIFTKTMNNSYSLLALLMNMDDEM